MKLLSIVAEKGSGQRSTLLPDWKEHLLNYSNYRADIVAKESMRRRLVNLVDRGLVERTSNVYHITEQGLHYLASSKGPVGAPETAEQTEIYKLVHRHRQQVRESLLEFLEKMDPIALEHLVRRLLEEMGYQNVQTTTPTNDKGVDVRADIELGITRVHEVVQVKRRQINLHRSVLDQLRGSLHRFGAIRGTIITTGGFSKGARDAAFEVGAAPITLIDGQKLVDLLIETELGVQTRRVELLDLNTETLTLAGESAEED